MDFRQICHVLFIVSAVLEAISLILVLVNINSPCVQAGEVTVLVTIYLFLFFCFFLPDLLFAILMMKCARLCTLGMDPTAIMFNFVAAFLSFIAGLALLLIFMFLCGHPAQIMLILAGVLLIFSCGVHIFNGCRCHKNLDDPDREWCKKAK